MFVAAAYSESVHDHAQLQSVTYKLANYTHNLMCTDNWTVLLYKLLDIMCYICICSYKIIISGHTCLIPDYDIQRRKLYQKTAN